VGHFVALRTEAHVLIFEFFPAFVMLVSLIVGIWLYVMDRQARGD
jgi:hypothetical protein